MTLSGTPYRSIRALGEGAMGEVIEAERGPGGARVVVKLLHRHLAARPDHVDRMRLEGEALGCARHPNVVAVLDRGVTDDGRPYLVLERLVGRTLRTELAERGPLPIAEAIQLAAQALDGLSAVHAAGVVHRDVKLENLFLCDAEPGSGRRVLKLLDLGVAKVLADGRPAPLANPTAEGCSMGTPRTFSPEQALGAALDARADVYAMGLVLYALITGRTPFDHLDDVAALLEAHATVEPPPPSSLMRAPLDPRLEAAVLRALAKHPDDRFPSARAFADELRAIARARRRPILREAKTFAAVLLASLALSMVGTALWHLATGR